MLGCAGSGGTSPPRSAVAWSSPARSTAPLVRNRVAEQPALAAAPDDPDKRAIFELMRASELFKTFVAKAGNEPEFAVAVRRSKERVADIDATLAFLNAGLRERKDR